MVTPASNHSRIQIQIYFRMKPKQCEKHDQKKRKNLQFLRKKRQT